MWLGARLGDALDCAFSKDVSHGDVKPSNILLTADGIPMMLDFNLARDSSPLASIDDVGDPGGTLAYMAPERLFALAASEANWADLRPPSEIAGRPVSTPPSQKSAVRHEMAPGLSAHQADIYSLGLVLLEAITTRTTEELKYRSTKVAKPALEQPRVSCKSVRASESAKCPCARRRGRISQWADDSSRSPGDS